MLDSPWWYVAGAVISAAGWVYALFFYKNKAATQSFLGSQLSVWGAVWITAHLGWDWQVVAAAMMMGVGGVVYGDS